MAPQKIADAAALILFVVAGMWSHDQGTLIAVFLRNAIPLLGAWFVAAAIVGTYRKPGLVVLVQTWIVAVSIGLVVRSLWLGSPRGAGLAAFVGIGLASTLVFLVAGRALVALVDGRGSPRRRRSDSPSA